MEIGPYTVKMTEVIARRNALRQKEFDRRAYIFDRKRAKDVAGRILNPGLSAEEEMRSLEWDLIQGV